MIKYKSFKLPGNAKLRIRSDSIVATVSSKINNSVDLYVANVSTPWRIKLDNEREVVNMVDYVWEKDSELKEDEE